MDYTPYRFKNYYKQKNKEKKKSNFKIVDSDIYNTSVYAKSDYRESASNKPEQFDATIADDYKAKEHSSLEIHQQEINIYRHSDKYERNKNNEGTESLIPNINSRKKKDKTGIFVVAIIMLSFFMVVLATEFLSGGMIVKELKSAFTSSDSIAYYMLTLPPYDNEYRATAEATNIKNECGAGYIYRKDNGYYVVLAVYLDKKTAENIKKKNDNTMLVTVGMKLSSFHSLNGVDGKLADKTLQTVIEKVEELYDISNKLESNEYIETKAIEKLSIIRNELLELKASIADSELLNANKNHLNKIIDPIFGGIDAIITVDSEDCLAGAVRYVICTTIMSYCQ